MSDDEVTNQQEATLRALMNLTKEQTNSLFLLLKNEPEITDFFVRRRAFTLVFGSIKKGALIVSGTLGAIWLGFEKIQTVIGFLVESAAKVVS